MPENKRIMSLTDRNQPDTKAGANSYRDGAGCSPSCNFKSYTLYSLHRKKVHTCGKAKYSKSRGTRGKVMKDAAMVGLVHLLLFIWPPSVLSTRLNKSVYFRLGETVLKPSFSVCRWVHVLWLNAWSGCSVGMCPFEGVGGWGSVHQGFVCLSVCTQKWMAPKYDALDLTKPPLASLKLFPYRIKHLLF